MAELPSGTVTFLFTDLEGSTRLWEEHPQAMNAALARHDAILRDAVIEHDGHIVKMTGDGIHAAFATADRAVAAALAAQRALHVEPWSETGPLRVRMGLHTGAAEQRDGDYFGPALNRGARLMSVANGGQVVVSEVTGGLVRNALPADAGLLDLGDHQMRDVPGRDRVFQLTHPDLSERFAPLRTVDVALGNLPAQATSFIGRQLEVANIADAIGSARVVTLTGVGGVGKTRLALEVAARATEQFRDGAWLCELAPVTDADAMLDAVATGLDAPQRMGQTLRESVLRFLAHKELLLVLDNCEHLIDAVSGLVKDIPGAAPGVHVIATSREVLGVPGERVVAVPSLEVAAVDADLDTIADAEGVRLFLARASEAKPGFALTSDNAATVTRLCQRLDGIPLAIELAAARVRAMTPAEISERLDQRFRLLTGRARGAVERHQTLRRAVDWSYDLLNGVEREALNRMSVFMGGCDLWAAEAVLAGDALDAVEVLDVLGQLVDKSLVIADDVGGTTRYRLLETVRQYAEEKLEERGEADAVRRRHAVHYMELAEEAGINLRGPAQLAWIARVDPDTDNFRAAVTWAIDAGDADLALRIVVALAVNPIAIGEAAMGWAELVADAGIGEDHPQLAATVAWAAWASTFRGNPERAGRLARRMEELQDTLGGVPHPLVFQARATLAFFAGDADGARTHAEQWVESVRVLDDLYELTIALAMLAPALDGIGRVDDASLVREEAVATGRRLGNASALSMALFTLAMHLTARDPQRAIAVLDETAQLSAEVGNEIALTGALDMKSALLVDMGDAHEALRTALLANDEVRKLGDFTALHRSLYVFGRALAALGEREPAAILTGASEGSDVVLMPEAADDFEAVKAALRGALGDDRFAELYERGLAMSDDDAVALARSEAVRVLAEERPPAQ